MRCGRKAMLPSQRRGDVLKSNQPNFEKPPFAEPVTDRIDGPLAQTPPLAAAETRGKRTMNPLTK
jgi:hypothetical protein